MKINEYINQSHEIAVEKGFYECPDHKEGFNGEEWVNCQSCNGRSDESPRANRMPTPGQADTACAARYHVASHSSCALHRG